MNVLIVESSRELSVLWQRPLANMGVRVCVARDEDAAAALLREVDFQVILLDLVLEEGSALSVADFASYRQPEAPVIFVTDTSFFSDGSIFQLCANARAFLPSSTPPEDLVAMVEHYGGALCPG
ncbi:response regulator [Salipiger abyssi]|uniref:response regulator n=1 Tax=Salipiger abyssi TaxID=1250539 RepID=UPI001A8D5128|nr:response regulator [Salipiger abyssi]MBN9886920.1 response regulator [Salipiger abyssi]